MSSDDAKHQGAEHDPGEKPTLRPASQINHDTAPILRDPEDGQDHEGHGDQLEQRETGTRSRRQCSLVVIEMEDPRHDDLKIGHPGPRGTGVCGLEREDVQPGKKCEARQAEAA